MTRTGATTRPQRRRRRPTPLNAVQRTFAVALRDAIAEARQHGASVTYSPGADGEREAKTEVIDLPDGTSVLSIGLSPEAHAKLLRLQAMMDDADPESDILALLERALTETIDERQR